MKTFDDFCVEVAINNGFSGWSDLCGQCDDQEPYYDQAAEAYAEYRAQEVESRLWNEGYTMQQKDFDSQKKVEIENHAYNVGWNAALDAAAESAPFRYRIVDKQSILKLKK